MLEIFEVKLEKVEKLQKQNYLSDTALFKISKNSNHIGSIEAEQRFYPVEKIKLLKQEFIILF